MSDWIKWDVASGKRPPTYFRVDVKLAAGYTVTKPRTIDDIEPMRRPPDRGTPYYMPDLSNTNLVVSENWNVDSHDETWLRRGLCYATREDAEIAARAMIALKGGVA